MLKVSKIPYSKIFHEEVSSFPPPYTKARQHQKCLKVEKIIIFSVKNSIHPFYSNMSFRGCVRWSPIWRMRAWRAWRPPGRWPDGGRGSTVARWMRRRAAPAYAPIPDLTWPEVITYSWSDANGRQISTCGSSSAILLHRCFLFQESPRGIVVSL